VNKNKSDKNIIKIEEISEKANNKQNKANYKKEAVVNKEQSNTDRTSLKFSSQNILKIPRLNLEFAKNSEAKVSRHNSIINVNSLRESNTVVFNNPITNFSNTQRSNSSGNINVNLK
jgi:hypothetical protein